MNQKRRPVFWKKHADKIGVAGSILAALGCLGFPAVLSILGAIGLGFLVNDAILIPLLALFLIVTLAGLFLGVRHHKRWLPFVVGAASAMLLFVSIVVAHNKSLAYLGLAGLIAASILNVWLRMRQRA
jgi:mercuric ion transport protein